MMDFFIFRHGQTDWNKSLLLQGRADIPINSMGVAQANALIPTLQDQSLDLLMASSLQRAVQTATIVGKALNIPVKADSRLMEIDFGHADGTSFENYIKTHGEAYFKRIFTSVADSDMDIPEDSRIIGAESKRHAQTRAMQALTDIAQHTSANTIGIACHGFIMTLIAAAASKGELYKFNNGDLLHIVYQNDDWHFVEVTRNEQGTGLKY